MNNDKFSAFLSITAIRFWPPTWRRPNGRIRKCQKRDVTCNELCAEVRHHINSVKHAFTIVVYGVVAMLEGRNVLAVLGKVRFKAITHDERYCLQLDSRQENGSSGIDGTSLRRGYTRQLCCYNSATKLQATNRTVCHRRYLLHATTFVACNMLPRIDQLSIPRNFVATKHQRRAACCTQQYSVWHTERFVAWNCCVQQSCLVYPLL